MAEAPKPTGVNSAMLASMKEHSSPNVHSSSDISSAQNNEDGSHPVSPDGKGISKMIGGSIDLKGGSIDELLGTMKDGAPFSRNPLTDVADGNLVGPAPGISGLGNTLNNVNFSGDLSLQNSSGLPNNTNLAPGISGTHNDTGRSS